MNTLSARVVQEPRLRGDDHLGVPHETYNTPGRSGHYETVATRRHRKSVLFFFFVFVQSL